MNTLQTNYRSVINRVAADIETLQQRELSVSGFKIRADDYICRCENFWKERHGRTYEKKMDELLEVKRRTAKIYSLNGFDA